MAGGGRRGGIDEMSLILLITDLGVFCVMLGVCLYFLLVFFNCCLCQNFYDAELI